MRTPRWIRLPSVLLGAVALIGVSVSCAPPTPPPPAAPVIQMIPNLGEGFYSMPWPNDIRRTPRGMPDWNTLPGVASNPFVEPLPTVPVLPLIVDAAQQTVNQFGTNTAVFLRSLVALDDSSLPSPAQSIEDAASVQLVDVATGEQAPAVVVAQERADRFRPAHLLTVLPYPGHPLRPDRDYAVLVFDTVRAASGSPLQPSPLLDQLRRAHDATMPMDTTQHAALAGQLLQVEQLTTTSTAYSPSDLVAFTVYRTQDTGREWNAVVDALDVTPVPPITVTAIDECTEFSTDPGAPLARVRATIALPTWQRGDFPYLLAGGDIGIGTDGRAIRTGTRVTPVQLLVPCTAAPASGWPVLTFVDGTGGDEDILTTRAPVRRTQMLYGQIAPLYGNGVGSAADLLQLVGFTTLRSQQEITFYNLLNPDAVRSNPLQQASDHLTFTRALSTFTLPGSALSQPVAGTVTADPARVVISGHSQGAQTLPLIASAAEDLIDGVVSSAGSGGQYHSIAHGPRRLESVGLLTIAPDRLDELNPLLHLVQTTIENTDAANFPTTQHYLNLSGYGDTCTTIETATHFARSQGLASYSSAPEISYGEPTLDRIPATDPVTANSNGRTRVQVIVPGGHFVYAANIDRLTRFAQEVFDGVAPTVFPSQFEARPNNCPGERYDDPPRLFGF